MAVSGGLTIFFFFLENESYSVSTLKEKKTMIRHHTRVKGNEDLPLLGAPTLRPPCFNVYELIKRGITRSKDAYTKE